MQSCGQVIVLCTAACLCLPLSCLAEGTLTLPPRNKQSLLALVRQASALQHARSTPRHVPLLQEQAHQIVPDEVTWVKRGDKPDAAPAEASATSGEGQQEEMAAGLQQVGVSLANNFLRQARSGRPYDVPQIGE